MKKPINWEYWQQLHCVKIWEACLLSLGEDPSSIPRELQIPLYVWSSASPQIVNALFSERISQSEYHQRLRIAVGFLEQPNVFTYVSKSDPNKHLWEVRLSEFAALANQKGLEIPPELNKLAAAPIAAETVDSTAAESRPKVENALGNKERDNLLRVIVGMAIRGYGYDPGAAKSITVGEILKDLDFLGIQLGDDTIRRYLKEGSTLIPRRSP